MLHSVAYASNGCCFIVENFAGMLFTLIEVIKNGEQDMVVSDKANWLCADIGCREGGFMRLKGVCAGLFLCNC